LGHLQNHRFIAYGLEIALLNDLKYNGGRIRVLVPSKLAYGVDGYGTGSVNTTDTHIGGNESLDYYVNVIYNQPAYDDLVIRNYLAAQSLTGYTKTTDGAYYKITTPPTTSTDPITINSTVTATYTGTLLDGIIFDSFTTTGGTPLNVIDQTAGVQECLQFVQTGASISMILPSALQYGNAGVSGKVSPISCVRYEYQIVSVTP
jgi:FKBP-type peptidyl-prolyl cis-trans isomerase